MEVSKKGKGNRKCKKLNASVRNLQFYSIVSKRPLKMFWGEKLTWFRLCFTIVVLKFEGA